MTDAVKKTIVVKQVASAARRPAKQTATLKGLGRARSLPSAT